MNKERLAEIAEWLEGGAKHKQDGVVFDMTEGLTINDCGTTCCIAGAAVQFFSTPEFKSILEGIRRTNDAVHVSEEYDWDVVFNMARDALDLDEATAVALFVPGEATRCGSDRLLTYNDPKWAARTIRHMIATDKVDWEAAKEV